jgi:transposase
MIHVDPASADFERLSRPEQARIYAGMGWDKNALAEEFGVTTETVRLWLDPERYERKLAREKEQRRSRPRTEAEKAKRRAWHRTPAGRAAQARYDAKRRPPKTSRRNLSPEKREAIRSAYLAGEKIGEIADTIGCALSTVNRILQPIRKSHKRGCPRKFDYDEAARLKGQGLTARIVAKRLGVSESRVFVALRHQREATK